ncbi:mechanosensitive ion channel domain-containing protein [Phenylobacterium sp.]|uniref:mechanosensitive ion channel family protein n=1 Tax=Phenylobacterium sp. TaxID=1871053 RepID=UPI0030F3F5CC
MTLAGPGVVMALLVFAATPAAAQAKIDTAVLGHLGDIIRWSGVVTSVGVLAAAWTILQLMGRFTQVFSVQLSTWRLTLQKVNTVGQFLVYVIATVLVVMLSFRIDETVLALIGGTIAVSVGFAMKDLVASFIAGIIIMLDRPFQVGDRVNFGGEYGDIVKIGLRSVRLQTLDDNTVTIPNSKFLSDMTSSGNYGALDMQVVIDIHIDQYEKIDEARGILDEAALSSRYIYLAKPVVVLVTQWIAGPLSGVRLRLKAYVLDTRFEKAFETDVTLRTLRAFSAAGIRPPAVRGLMAFAEAPPAD